MIMKRLSALLCAMAFCMALQAQPDETTREGMSRLSCTSIMVGKKASADGSVITSHTCDSWYRTWMQVVAARDHEDGEVTAI